MRDDDLDRLPAPLSDAVPLLRELPTVRAEWRADVLREVARPDRPTRRVSLSVPLAIAAGLFCAMAGGGVAMFASRARATASPTAIAAASPLLTTVLPVRFSVVAPRAARVSIVGDFNHWNPTTLPMRRSADGQTWEVEVKLPVGRYSYAFLIDGAFAPDPAAPRGSGDDFGTPNSVLMVRGS
jgi:predicted carbohydrate-binding protein with CBM48